MICWLRKKKSNYSEKLRQSRKKFYNNNKMKTNFESHEKFMQFNLDEIEVLNENEFLLVRGGKSDTVPPSY